jgi:hypothetical protein
VRKCEVCVIVSDVNDEAESGSKVPFYFVAFINSVYVMKLKQMLSVQR